MQRLIATHLEEEQAVAVTASEIRIGSAPENDLVIRARGVSKSHALVRRAPGGVEVVDLGSKNGLFFQGRRVEKVVLAPGLQVQIGAARLGLEEITDSEEQLALMAEGGDTTETIVPGREPRSPSPVDAALALACQIEEKGATLPLGGDLLARIKAVLGAELFAIISREGKMLKVWERDGDLHAGDSKCIAPLMKEGDPPSRLVLKRAGAFLITGREGQYLVARLSGEIAAGEGWRKDFMRFLGWRLFAPVRPLHELSSAEAERVVRLAGGNKSRAAKLLDVSRTTLHSLLRRRRQ